VKELAELLVLPPANLLILLGVGLVLAALRWRRTGLILSAIAAVGLYVLATPLVSTRFLESLEGTPVDLAALAGRQNAAIVILSGDVQRDTPDYGGDTVGGLTLERLRYGARLHRATRLPVLVSGGTVDRSKVPVAALMRDTLAEDFGVRVRWVEDRSTTTWENAQFSAPMLEADGVRTVVLVTNSWHMPRAAAAFRAAGLTVVPAPTLFTAPADLDGGSLLPSARALLKSYYAAHEWVGRLWYARLAATHTKGQ
jgi:uncharacterized SAM-binding protein YcdF (DUF218 family)